MHDKHRSNHAAKPARALCARVLGMLGCLAAPAVGQDADNHGGDSTDSSLIEQPLAVSEPRAAFMFRPVGSDRHSQPTTPARVELQPLVLEFDGVAAHDPDTMNIERSTSPAALIVASHPLDQDEPTADLAAHFAFSTLESTQLFNDNANRWARSVYSKDAELLTSLTAGQEVLGWQLTDGFRLAGVGSRRVWTDRDRAFVVSAEAGLRLSPHSGLQLGYELLQTSSGGSFSTDLGGESVFARFQLRF